MEKEANLKAVEESKAHYKLQTEQLHKAEEKASQVSTLEKEVAQLQLLLEQRKERTSTDSSKVDPAKQEMLKQQVMQVQMNADYQSMQYQNDIIKFKMQIRELET